MHRGSTELCKFVHQRCLKLREYKIRGLFPFLPLQSLADTSQSTNLTITRGE